MFSGCSLEMEGQTVLMGFNEVGGEGRGTECQGLSLSNGKLWLFTTIRNRMSKEQDLGQGSSNVLF